METPAVRTCRILLARKRAQVPGACFRSRYGTQCAMCVGNYFRCEIASEVQLGFVLGDDLTYAVSQCSGCRCLRLDARRRCCTCARAARFVRRHARRLPDLQSCGHAELRRICCRRRTCHRRHERRLRDQDISEPLDAGDRSLGGEPWHRGEQVHSAAARVPHTLLPLAHLPATPRPPAWTVS